MLKLSYKKCMIISWMWLFVWTILREDYMIQIKNICVWRWFGPLRTMLVKISSWMCLRKYIIFCWCLRKCLIWGRKQGILRSIFLLKLLCIIVRKNHLNFGNGSLGKLRDSINMVLISACRPRIKILGKKPSKICWQI